MLAANLAPTRHAASAALNRVNGGWAPSRPVPSRAPRPHRVVKSAGLHLRRRLRLCHDRGPPQAPIPWLEPATAVNKMQLPDNRNYLARQHRQCDVFAPCAAESSSPPADANKARNGTPARGG